MGAGSGGCHPRLMSGTPPGCVPTITRTDVEHPQVNMQKVLPESNLDYSSGMFDVILTQLATVGDKLAHLRRFL
jgi:hypothetical protein